MCLRGQEIKFQRLHATILVTGNHIAHVDKITSTTATPNSISNLKEQIVRSVLRGLMLADDMKSSIKSIESSLQYAKVTKTLNSTGHAIGEKQKSY